MDSLKLYLEYLDEIELVENKWTALLRAGKITPSQLKRIQQFRPGPDKLYVKALLKKGDFRGAQEYLAKKGIVKSARSWLDAVEKGTKNILKKHNVDVKYSIGSNRYGSHVTADVDNKVTANFASGVKKKEFGNNAIIKRHEADEARIRLKQQKKTGLHGFDLRDLSSKGKHASDEVLRRERELVTTSKSLYGKKVIPNKTGIADIRKKTGEYDNLKSKKEIKKFDKERLKQNAVLNNERSVIEKKIEENNRKRILVQNRVINAEKKLKEKRDRLERELKDKKLDFYENMDARRKIDDWYYGSIKKIIDKQKYILGRISSENEKLMYQRDHITFSSLKKG